MAFVVRFAHARPGATQYSVTLHPPQPWDQIAISQGPSRISQADGAAVAEIGSPITDQLLPSIEFFPPGVYRVDLQVDGRVAAHTGFTVQPGVVAFYTTTRAMIDNTPDSGVMPRVTAFSAGTAGIDLAWEIQGITAKTVPGRFIVHNRSTGASASIPMQSLPTSGLGEMCVNASGDECRAHDRPYAPGSYEVELVLSGYGAASTSFKIGS